MEEDFKIKELKDLPRSLDGEIERYFMANGNKYCILSIDECLTPYRYTEFERMSIVGSFAMNFDVLFTQLRSLEGKIHQMDLSDDTAKTPPIVLLNAIQNGIIKSGQMRWEQMAVFCSLFIVREKEDLRVWSIEDANDKVADWNAEGYRMKDFFQLGAIAIPKFAPEYVRLVKEQMKIRAMGLSLQGIESTLMEQ
jgi:hypothetical protein